MNNTTKYLTDRNKQVKKNWQDADLQMANRIMTDNLIRTNYIKNFTWLGRPVLQYPPDLMVMQELIWQLKPDFIVETGVAFGGSTVFFASMLELIGGLGQVIAVDIDVKPENHAEINKYNFSHRIKLIQADSTNFKTIKHINELIMIGKTVMVMLDSNHTEEHVLRELELYSPMVTVGSYLIVNDTSIEQWDERYPSPDRPWSKGNNPMTAVDKFMNQTDQFTYYYLAETRALITGSPNGWLKRIK